MNLNTYRSAPLIEFYKAGLFVLMKLLLITLKLNKITESKAVWFFNHENHVQKASISFYHQTNTAKQETKQETSLKKHYSNKRMCA